MERSSFSNLLRWKINWVLFNYKQPFQTCTIREPREFYTRPTRKREERKRTHLEDTLYSVERSWLRTSRAEIKIIPSPSVHGGAGRGRRSPSFDQWMSYTQKTYLLVSMTNFKLVQAFDPHPLRLPVSDKYQYAQASGFFPPPEIGTVYVTIIIQPALHNHGGQNIFFVKYQHA